MSEKIRVLFIGAHHEEIEAECPNIAAQLTRHGCEVTILNPIGGWNWKFIRDLSGDGRERTIEDATNAAKALGCRKIIWDYPIYKVERNMHEIMDRLSEFILDYRPQIVLIHWPLDCNPDHRCVAHISRHALSGAVHIMESDRESTGIKEVYAYQTGVAQAYHFMPDLLVRTDEESMKMADECIEAFSPTASCYVPMWKANFHAKAEYWGTTLEGGGAEGLKFLGPVLPLEGFLLKKILGDKVVPYPLYEPYSYNKDFQL